MISSLIPKLNKNWYIDDTAQVFKGVIDDPSEFATWKDVEYCMNNPQFYNIKFIDKNSGEYIGVQKYPHVWRHDHEDVHELMEIYKAGHCMIINNFDSGLPKQQEILGHFEKHFTAKMAMHLYAGLDKCRSFNIHEDTASNFIIQVEGETQWTVYKNKCSNIIDRTASYPEVELTYHGIEDMIPFLEVQVSTLLVPGDILYIPARCYHQAQPHGKRLSVSIPMQHMIPHIKPIDRKYYEIPH